MRSFTQSTSARIANHSSHKDKKMIYIEIAVCLMSFTLGIALAFPSILNQALLAPEPDIKVTKDQASWIATCLGFGSLLGFAIIPTIFEIFGRKTANIVTNIFICIGNLMLYVADDAYMLAFARITQGLAIGGTFMSAIALCECISPKRRGYFMVFNMLSLGLGSLACHLSGIFFSWRHIAIFGGSINLVSICLNFILAESPRFLAMREEFDKCAETFVWYRGDSSDSKRELKEFISAQMENSRRKEMSNNVSVFKRAKDMIKTKEFQKSFCILTLTTLCLETCGRYYSLAYITQILIQLTNNVSLALYISVATDLVLVFALGISTVIVKYFDRRTLLFTSGFGSVFLMFMISFSVILSKFEVFENFIWLTPTIILLHTYVINIGLVPITFVLCGEVFPLHQKGLGSFLTGFLFLSVFNVVMKLTPFMIETTGVEGTYSIYGIFLFIFLILLGKILPETKDKTLQQIEDELKGIERRKDTSNIELIKYSETNST